jgi:hypothetical protein
MPLGWSKNLLKGFRAKGVDHHKGIPAIIPAEARYLGWQESLTLLAPLVEPEIPDQL